MHELVGIHGAGDSDHAKDDEQVNDGDPEGRRRVQRPKSGQTQEPDRREGQDAARGKALLAPAVADAEQRQACRNHQQVQGLRDRVAAFAGPGPIDHSGR